MEEKTVQNNKDLSKYISEFNDDIALNLHNIREKSLMVSTIRAKWLGYYMAEKENLKKIQKLKTSILNKKVNTGSSVLRLKNEETLEKEDENLKKLNVLNDYTKENIDFIERAMNIVADFGFSIKNTIEIMKLEQS